MMLGEAMSIFARSTAAPSGNWPSRIWRNRARFWAGVRLRNGKTPSHVFLNRSENQLTRRGLTSLLCRRCRKAGVEGPDNPHAFRHGFAVAFLENDGGIHNLQRLMGHASLGSTLLYLGSSDKLAERDHAKASPGDHLNGEQE